MHVKLVQLPIPQVARFSPSGNVPLAAGSLVVAGRQASLPGTTISMIDVDAIESLGDTLLAEELARGEPAAVGFSLYLWNTERSLHVAREVKRRSPSTKILVGGPEVAPDNAFLLASNGFDIAVTGEAEEIFPRVLERLAQDRCAGGLPGVAVRGAQGLSPFKAADAPSFALTKFPSPYLANAIAVDPRRAAYVETVRGCRSHCSFCFYPRSSAVLRALDVKSSVELIADLAEHGAREIVFLDPTFNHRPNFEELLRAIAEVNRDHRLRFFGEVRAEGLTELHADLLAQAGFYKLEIGLQSVNPIALARTRRGGNKDLVAKAAHLLEARGIDLLIDLIVGLPGDAREHVVAGIEFLRAERLGRYAQVFPLQILPGTELRANAVAEGIEYDPRPPYRVRRTATLDESTIDELLALAEERLDRRLDEVPRPFLCDRDPSIHDVLKIDLDDPAQRTTECSRPGAAHFALWFRANDLWAHRDAIALAIRQRIAVDPYSILDVVLAPHRPFPTNLLDFIRRELEAEPKGYACRSALLAGEDPGRRITLVLERGREFGEDWIEAIRAEIPVYREMNAEEAFERGSRLGVDEPGARIVGEIPEGIDSLLLAFETLCHPADVTFADRSLERRFVG